ncbi:MAG TPA: AI-2E family transporter [Pilimelia sp.]|nr:AI-2E family transporter [Pilimelia sp.]
MSMRRPSPRAGLRRLAPRALLRVAVVAGCLLVVAAAVAVLAWILVRLAPLTLALAAALLLAALLSPVATLLRRWRAPDWLAALGAVLFLLAVVIGPLALVTNQAVAQFDDLENQVIEGLERIRRSLTSGPLTRGQLDRMVEGLVTTLRGSAPDPVSGAATAVQTLAAVMLSLVFLFFLLRDGDRIWCWILGLVPRAHHGRTDAAARAGWGTLVAYVRGTVVVAAADAVGIGVALVILDIPLALGLAVLTFLFAFVPIVGAIVAGAAAVLVALVSNGPTDALLVLGAVVLVQQAESNLLQPFVMGRALRLHPAVVLLAVSAGTLVGGIAGAVVAVPVVAVAYRAAVQASRYAPADPRPAAPQAALDAPPAGAPARDGPGTGEDPAAPDPPADRP